MAILAQGNFDSSVLLQLANLVTLLSLTPWWKNGKRSHKTQTYTVCSSCSVGWFWDDQLRKDCWKCGAVVAQTVKSQSPRQEPQKDTTNFIHQLKSVLGRMSSVTDGPSAQWKTQIQALVSQMSSESGKTVPIETQVGQASQRVTPPTRMRTSC